MSLMRMVGEAFTDVAEHNDVTDPDNTRRLHLKVIGTPQLLKSAHNLFTLARGDNEDHSGYPQFLIDLDRLLIKNGGTPTKEENQEEEDPERADQKALDGQVVDNDDDGDWK